MITVRVFASLRELLGRPVLQLPAAPDSTVERLFEILASDEPQLRPYRSSLLAAVNAEYADWETPVKEGDEVAFFPPVSGGAS